MLNGVDSDVVGAQPMLNGVQSEVDSSGFWETNALKGNGVVGHPAGR